MPGRLLSIAIFVISALSGFNAAGAEIRDIAVHLTVLQDGSARVEEKWDVTVDSGTEYYLPRYDLGDIEIRDFSVSENGGRFESLASWEVDAPMARKARKCGLNRVNQGVELCWGIESYGAHVWTLSYIMTNAVKSLDDYDILHLQLVNPGLSARPAHVRVDIDVEGRQIDTTNTRLWGFGYEGVTGFGNGAACLESTARFVSNSSVIALMRFDKGVVASPSSRRPGSFDDVFYEALEGADFGRDDEDSSEETGAILSIILFTLAFIGLPVVAAVLRKRSVRKAYLGTTDVDGILWCRDIPFGGSLPGGRNVFEKLGSSCTPGQLAAAMIVRMVDCGAIGIRQDDGGKSELTMLDEGRAEALGLGYGKLWNMISAAAGDDAVLQNREFCRWSRRNAKTVSSWIDTVTAQGEADIAKYRSGKGLDAQGQGEARKLVGLKKFLVDYTLIKERGAGEAVLWKDYLAFAALLGVADKVAAQLKEIDPRKFEEAVAIDSGANWVILRSADQIGRQIVSAKSLYDARSAGSGAHATSWRGGGGFSSFGGGGGFSGGGFGGGSR